MNNLKEILNKEQYSAVTLDKGSILVLAGAGSGKTRVITYKIVHLINTGISPKKYLQLLLQIKQQMK